MKILWLFFISLLVSNVFWLSEPVTVTSEVASSTPNVADSATTSPEKKSVVAKNKTVASRKTQLAAQKITNIATTSTIIPTVQVKIEIQPPVSKTDPVISNGSFVDRVEAEILRLTNAERSKNDLSTLSSNATLSRIARGHSADMLAHDYFSHEGRDGCGSSCRATNGGYSWRMIGENIYRAPFQPHALIAQGASSYSDQRGLTPCETERCAVYMLSGYDYPPEEIATTIVNGWMNSPGHRANILKDGYAEGGVGIATDGNGGQIKIYATAMYGTHK